jgi:hypothetical protein
VLKPGGFMVGYDLLDGLILRAFHSAEGAGFRLIRLEDFERTLDALPADRVYTRVGVGKMLIRFRIRKQPSGHRLSTRPSCNKSNKCLVFTGNELITSNTHFCPIKALSRQALTPPCLPDNGPARDTRKEPRFAL